ncbi:unnamed protein product, partial [marine sediment metagenome]
MKKIKKISLKHQLSYKKNYRKLLVTGAGRSCTNWVTQICKATGRFNFYGPSEDRNFPWKIFLEPKYATKLATENSGFIKCMLKRKLKLYKNLKIIWCFKHPVANAMAKIIRGQPTSRGGDSESNFRAIDATLKTAIAAIKKSFN